jgi:tetratricopeptide (TPR) repeat protein
LKLNEALFSRSYTPVVTTVLCADYALSGEWSEAQRYAKQAVALERYEMVPYAGIPRWFVTETLLHTGNTALAEEYIGKLGQYHEEGRRDRIEYLQASASLAQWEGQLGQALSHLEEARALAEEIGLPGELWHIQTALAGLYQSRGEQVLAGQFCSQAAAVVHELTAMIEDEALRTGFLAAPRVRHILDGSIPIAMTND